MRSLHRRGRCLLRLHPTFYAMTDAQRTSPESLAAVRRSISSAILIDADTTLNAAEVAYGGYAAMGPRGPATLPTTFTFSVAAGVKARADTMQASDAGLVPDAHYSWGTEQQYPKADGGVSWTAQSMVFPIQWP